MVGSGEYRYKRTHDLKRKDLTQENQALIRGGINLGDFFVGRRVN